MRNNLSALSAAIVRSRVATRGTSQYTAARRAWQRIAAASGLSQPEAATIQRSQIGLQQGSDYERAIGTGQPGAGAVD